MDGSWRLLFVFDGHVLPLSFGFLLDFQLYYLQKFRSAELLLLAGTRLSVALI